MAAPEPNQPRPLEISRRDTLSFLQHRPEPSDMRNLLLVVAALVAATTFQAAVNPPGGVWQDNLVINGTTIHYAGKSVLASNPGEYKTFIFCNSVAFSSSALVIGSLINGFPYFVETYLALLSMTVTYGAAVAAVEPPDTTGLPFLIALLVPYIVSYVVRKINRYRNQGGDD